MWLLAAINPICHGYWCKNLHVSGKINDNILELSELTLAKKAVRSMPICFDKIQLSPYLLAGLPNATSSKDLTQQAFVSVNHDLKKVALIVI